MPDKVLDILLSLLHFLIIGFNLFGWIWRPLWRAHLVCVLLTAGSWLVLGIWYGIGYCPITDWQWDVKRRLGERDLPSSFIKYYADKITGNDISPSLVNTWTAILFIAVALISIYVNFFRKRGVGSKEK